MSFQKNILLRGIDVYTNIGANDYTKKLLLEHARYCGAAVYHPPPPISDVRLCIEYLEMLKTYAGECEKKFQPYVVYPVSPENAMDTHKLRANIENAKAKGLVGVVCRLREWNPEFYLAMTNHIQNGNRGKAPEMNEGTTQLHRILEIVERLDFPIFFDAGFPKNNDDPMRNWEINGVTALQFIYKMFPRLRCLVLHVTTSEMVSLILDLSDTANGGSDICGAITPQHMFMCDLGVGLRKYPGNPIPIPLPQTIEERGILRSLIAQSTKKFRNFMFSTDSACMICGCVCGGWCGAVTSIPHAISIMLEGFEKFPLEPELDGFMVKSPIRFFRGMKHPEGTFEVHSEIVSDPAKNRVLGEFAGEKISFTGVKCLWHIR